MFAANYPLLSVCLNELSFFFANVLVLKSLSVSTRLSNNVIRRWGALGQPPCTGIVRRTLREATSLSRYFHAIYRSAEIKEKYFQPRRFRRCCKNDKVLHVNHSCFIQHEQREAYNVNRL